MKESMKRKKEPLEGREWAIFSFVIWTILSLLLIFKTEKAFIGGPGKTVLQGNAYIILLKIVGIIMLGTAIYILMKLLRNKKKK